MYIMLLSLKARNEKSVILHESTLLLYCHFIGLIEGVIRINIGELVTKRNKY